MRNYNSGDGGIIKHFLSTLRYLNPMRGVHRFRSYHEWRFYSFYIYNFEHFRIELGEFFYSYQMLNSSCFWVEFTCNSASCYDEAYIRKILGFWEDKFFGFFFYFY